MGQNRYLRSCAKCFEQQLRCILSLGWSQESTSGATERRREEIVSLSCVIVAREHSGSTGEGGHATNCLAWSVHSKKVESGGFLRAESRLARFVLLNCGVSQSMCSNPHGLPLYLF